MFENFLKKKEKEVHHLDFDLDLEDKMRHSVKVVTLKDIKDVENLRMKFPKHDVFLCNVSSFRDLDDLKRAISRIKIQAGKYGGEVYGLDSSWIVVTTEDAVIER